MNVADLIQEFHRQVPEAAYETHREITVRHQEGNLVLTFIIHRDYGRPYIKFRTQMPIDYPPNMVALRAQYVFQEFHKMIKRGDFE